MENFVWFLSLLLISFLLILLTYKRKHYFGRNLAVYFLIAGLSFIFDFFILILFHAYTYYPLVLKDRWADDILGSLFSQGFFIPSIMMIIAAYQLKTSRVIFIIIGIAIIEELFLFLGLYEHNWWHTIYTMAILFAGSFFVKWWRKLLDNPPVYVRFTTLFMLFTVLFNTASFLFAMIFKTYWYSVGWFSNNHVDHLVLDILISGTYTFVLTLMVQYSSKLKTIVIFFLFDLCFLWIMFKAEFLYLKGVGVIPAHALLLVIIILAVYRMDRYFFPDNAGSVS